MKSYLSLGFKDPTPSMWWYTAWTRTKARFVRTYLGNIWIGLSNLLAVCVLGFVYRYVFSVDNFKYYFGYLAIGITLWSFISGTILSSAGVFQATRDRSLNSEFTPSYYFLEEFCFQFLCFIQASLPIIIVTLIFGMVEFLNLFVAIIPLINMVLMVFSFSGLAALIGGKFKDAGQLFPVIFQLMFFTSPIMFFRSAMGRAYIIAQYNPIYRILSSVRSSLVDGHISFTLQLITLPILLCTSIYIYRRIVNLRNKIILWY
ncbi:ABC transporter permease [uncultured Prochlorococcus sp.]|uniref:ABC transporter permease n=1 Tax=uncultured Prochlorococcus sp. TaxID=159733 RepID=UPI002582ACD5|nr:ABC transporter permease [uncultured Prochlorococcus sp.]